MSTAASGWSACAAAARGLLAVKAMARWVIRGIAGGGAGAFPMYQGSSSGRPWYRPDRVVARTSSTAGQSSPVCWVTSAR